MAAGAVVVTRLDLGGGIQKVSVAWTSSAGGAVSGNGFAVPRGELLQVKFVPGAGGVQPSDLYDVTIVDEDAVDVAIGNGADCGNAATRLRVPLTGSAAGATHRVLLDGTQLLDVVVANAGNAKSGTVVLLIGR
jgi:hypothetical protein